MSSSATTAPEPSSQEAEKRLQIHKYFQPFPKWAVVLVALGMLFFLADSHWVGSFVFLLGALAISAWRDRPSDPQLDAWIDEDLESLRPPALVKCGLVPEEEIREPILIHGPRFVDLGGARLGFRRGQDGVIRFTPIHVAVVHFTQDFLSVYECALDLFTGGHRNQAAHENYYPDIVAVSTKSQTVNLSLNTLPKWLTKKLGKATEAIQGSVGKVLPIDQGEQFEMTTSGGTSVRIFLKAPALARCVGNGEWPARDTEQAVQTIRKMLREKKTV